MSHRDHRIAYLSGRYPAVSHTFIMREVEALRRLGLGIETLSVHRARREDLLTEADRQAFRTTFAVLPISLKRLLGAHWEAFGAGPLRYLKTLVLALRIAPPGVRGLVWQLFYFAEAMVIWRQCRRVGVRHIHAQFADTATESALLASHFGSDDGRGWSWSLAVHGPVEFYDVSLNRLGEKLRRARFALSISEFGRSQLMTLVDEEHWPRLHVVRCGLDPAWFDPAAPASRSGDDVRVVCVGRLVHHKGHAVLLEALAELTERGDAVTATVVGDGPKRSDLERLAARLGIEDRVTFTGSVGQDRIRDLYAAADIFCLPSFAEGLPVVLMEAMATGLPVVTTRIMGIPELVEHEVSGLLVVPGRADQLADGLKRLIDDPDMRHRLGAAGRDRVVSDFDVDRSAARLAEIFSRELERS